MTHNTTLKNKALTITCVLEYKCKSAEVGSKFLGNNILILVFNNILTLEMFQGSVLCYLVNKSLSTV